MSMFHRFCFVCEKTGPRGLAHRTLLSLVRVGQVGRPEGAY